MIYGNKVGGARAEKTYIIEIGGAELIGVVVDQKEIFDARPKDVMAGKKFGCESGVCIGTSDASHCYVTKGMQEISPGADFVLTLPEKDQWDYSELQCMMAPKNSPYAIDKVVLNNAVYDTSGTKIAEVTKDGEKDRVCLNIINSTNNTYLLYFFIYKEEIS